MRAALVQKYLKEEVLTSSGFVYRRGFFFKPKAPILAGAWLDQSDQCNACVIPKVFAMPLYRPIDYLYFSYSFETARPGKYCWDLDDVADRHGLASTLLEDALPFVQHLLSPDALLNFIVNGEPSTGKMDSNRWEDATLLAVTAAPERCAEFLELWGQYVSAEISRRGPLDWLKASEARRSDLADALGTGVPQAKALLRRWFNFTCKSLNLEDQFAGVFPVLRNSGEGKVCRLLKAYLQDDVVSRY